MSDLTRIEERFRMANPIPDPADPPVTASTAAAVLLDLEERTGTMQTQETIQKTTPPRRRWNGALVGAAAFAVVAIVGVALLLASGGSDQLAPATTVTTQAPPTTVAPLPLTVDEALAVKDAYIAAYNAGDTDAVLGLFGPDPTISGPSAGNLLRFERGLVWDAAQQTTVTASDCTANELEDAVYVKCGYTNHQYVAVAVGAPPLEGTLTLTVTPDGIRAKSEGYSSGFAGSDFTGNKQFERWMREHHPEDVSIVECCGWGSLAEAEQGGILRAQYADEWAAYLEANGCTYTDTDC